jgi:hypothetical protein
MKRIFLTSIIIGLLAGSVIAQHQGMVSMAPPDFAKREFVPWSDGDHGKRSDNTHRALMGIDLTDSQEKSLEKIKREHNVTMTELRSDIAGIHAKGKLLIVNDKVKDSEIKDFAAKISHFSEKMAYKRISHARVVRNLLTEDQRLEFDNNILSHGAPKHKKMKHMRKRMRGMHGNHGRGD